MSRIKLTLEYDGTAYHGWQKQLHQVSIQGEIETALLRLTQQATRVHGAGRTDAGVHALAQVAHFDSTASFSPTEWRRALNALLPQDIAVTQAEAVDETFHARFSAKEKIYRYQILNAKHRSPLRRRTQWWLRSELNLEKMLVAAKHLTGFHCFTSFCAAACDVTDHDIDLKQLQIAASGEEIDITLRAPRFLRYMVRNIVGFLVEVGSEKRFPDEVPEILAKKDRCAAGLTAPPQGLILVKVYYS